MRFCFPALLLTFALAAPAAADDVPLPVKKPRDAKGQPIVTGGEAPRAADRKPGGTAKLQGPDKGPDKGSGAGWPKTLDDAKAEAEAAAKPETIATEWAPEEIAAAQAQCKAMLAKIDAVTLSEAPFRKGECGTPAPVRLVSIGKKPEVSLSPPPILTCDMVGALHAWLTKDLQPLARKTLGADVIKIESMSDYSCRNAYGRTKTKLSEHGRANALDIRGFMTAKGETVAVLTGWGDTQRDIAARELALKKAAEKAAAKAAEAALTSAPAAAPAAAGAAATSNKTIPADGPAVRKTILEGLPAAANEPAFGVAPARLGGPAAAPAPPARMTTFLKGAHAAACRIFGTTLGPEANNAHRNHFHVDMAPRARTKICD